MGSCSSVCEYNEECQNMTSNVEAINGQEYKNYCVQHRCRYMAEEIQQCANPICADEGEFCYYHETTIDQKK